MRSLSVVSLLVCGAADVPWLDTSAEAPERTPPAPEVYARKDAGWRKQHARKSLPPSASPLACSYCTWVDHSSAPPGSAFSAHTQIEVLCFHFERARRCCRRHRSTAAPHSTAKTAQHRTAP